MGGHNKIKMTDLKLLLEYLGFKNVQTYIQSGNIIFNSNHIYREKIEETILHAIENKFKYSINVLVLTKNELKAIFKENPFLKIKNIDDSKLHVTILKNNPDLDEVPTIQNLIKDNDDEFQIVDKNVFIYCPNGYGKTKLNNNIIEKKLKSPGTTRNWKTISKLIELSK